MDTSYFELPAGPASPPPVSSNLYDEQGHHLGAYRAAVQSTRMPMLLSDPNQHDNPVVFANEAFLEMTHYRWQDIAGQNCRFLQGPDTNPDSVRAIRDALTEVRPIDIEILNYRAPQHAGDQFGESFWNALYIRPIFDEAGKLVYFFASQLDISRRRNVENALRQAQKLEAVGRLTAGISHDFNNMLMVITGQLDLLLMQEQSPTRKVMLQQALSAAERGVLLNKQLLAFAKKQKLETRVTNLDTMVGDIWGMIRTLLGSGIELTADLQERTKNVEIDTAQAEQALVNVLINARAALGKAGRITVRTRDINIAAHDRWIVGDRPAGDYVTLEVVDNGAGMTSETLAHATEPFYTTKPVGQGTGMGLAQVSGFVQQSNGWLDIQSEVGRGTTIRMYFPAIDGGIPYETTDSSRTPLAAPAKSRDTVLVIDDTIDVLDTIKRILRSFDYEVYSATSGNDALMILRNPSIPVSLLLTDYSMSGMNGADLAVEAHRLRPEMPIVLVTGYADPEALGTDYPVLTKPVRVGPLIDTVKRAINGPSGVDT